MWIPMYRFRESCIQAQQYNGTTYSSSSHHFHQSMSWLHCIVKRRRYTGHWSTGTGWKCNLEDIWGIVNDEDLKELRCDLLIKMDTFLNQYDTNIYIFHIGCHFWTSWQICYNCCTVAKWNNLSTKGMTPDFATFLTALFPQLKT